MTGAEAIQQSKTAREQQDVSRLKDEAKPMRCGELEARRSIWSTAFGLIPSSKLNRVCRKRLLMFGSDEYFALLKQNPKLGSYFSLGERVVVVFEGRVYRVNAPAP